MRQYINHNSGGENGKKTRDSSLDTHCGRLPSWNLNLLANIKTDARIYMDYETTRNPHTGSHGDRFMESGKRRQDAGIEVKVFS